jgi:hypothetical protein
MKTEEEKDIKQVIGQLFKQFEQEEQGNRVTPNNMFALLTKVGMAVAGDIKINKGEVPGNDKAKKSG